MGPVAGVTSITGRFGHNMVLRRPRCGPQIRVVLPALFQFGEDALQVDKGVQAGVPTQELTGLPAADCIDVSAYNGL